MKGFMRRLIRFRLRTLFVLVTTLCLYLGSYLALREPVVGYDQSVTYSGNWMSIRLTPVNNPQYRLGGAFARAVFSPIAWIDWQFREDYWVQRNSDRIERENARNLPNDR